MPPSIRHGGDPTSRLDRAVKCSVASSVLLAEEALELGGELVAGRSRWLPAGGVLVGLRLELAHHRLVLGVVGDELVDAGAVGRRAAWPGPPVGRSRPADGGQPSSSARLAAGYGMAAT